MTRGGTTASLQLVQPTVASSISLDELPVIPLSTERASTERASYVLARTGGAPAAPARREEEQVQDGSTPIARTVSVSMRRPRQLSGAASTLGRSAVPSALSAARNLPSTAATLMCPALVRAPSALVPRATCVGSVRSDAPVAPALLVVRPRTNRGLVDDSQRHRALTCPTLPRSKARSRSRQPSFGSIPRASHTR